MQKQDWVAAGIKIIGVYIGALALIFIGSTIVNTLMTLCFSDRPANVTVLKMAYMVLVKVLLVGLVVPMTQAAVAWLLLKRTEWCLKKIGIGDEPLQM